MSIITLTTDYGNKDYFVSSLKAKIVSEIDSAEIIETVVLPKIINETSGLEIFNEVFTHSILCCLINVF